MKINVKDLSKKKTYNYSTTVTASKLEYTLGWILGLFVIIGAILIILFVDFILVACLSIFGLIIIFILFGIIVIFSKKHKEERIKNTQIHKN